MATKADFTPEQWEELQWSVTDTTAYLALAHPGFWESFKEAGAAASYLATAREKNESTFIRDLAGDPKMGTDPTVSKDMTAMGDRVAERLTGAAKLVAEKAPDDLDAFKAFIVGLGEAAAAASGDTDAAESAALDKVKAALG